jgi:hypothetical protein
VGFDIFKLLVEFLSVNDHSQSLSDAGPALL